MSLVAYSDDEDSGGEEPVVQPEPAKTVVSNGQSNTDEDRSISELKNSIIIDESKKNHSAKKAEKAKKKPIKITVPSLSQYRDVDLPKKPGPPAARNVKRASDLISVLPPPKRMIKEKLFVPTILRSKNVETITKPPPKKADTGDDDDDDFVIPTQGDDAFKSLWGDMNAPARRKVLSETGTVAKVNSAKQVFDPAKSNKYFAELYNKKEEKEDGKEKKKDGVDSDLDDVIRRELQPRRKPVYSTSGNIDLIDVSVAELTPNANEMVLQSLTEDATAPEKVEDVPTHHKRKHQITYLAQQAKAREQELKNQWALNRQSRRQTQSKYGF